MVGTKNGEDPVVETTADLENFEIAGSNKVFVGATATIDADTVLVSSPSISEPLYVRYCYANAPVGGNKLYNRAGFPKQTGRSVSGAACVDLCPCRAASWRKGFRIGRAP